MRLSKSFRAFGVLYWVVTFELFGTALTHAGEVLPNNINSMEPIADRQIGTMSFSEPKISLESATEAKSPQKNSNLLSQQSVQGSNIKPTSSWYVGGGLGLVSPSFSGSGTTTASNGNTFPFTGSLNSSSAIGFNAFAGLKSSFGRSELELFYTNNSVNSTTTNFPTNPALNGTTQLSGASTSHFAVMLDYYYDISTGSNFTPFIGAGVGYGSTNFNLNGEGFNSSGFVYQLKVGSAYTISDNTDIYLQYRYLKTSPFTFTSSGGTKTNVDGNYSSFEIGTRFSF